MDAKEKSKTYRYEIADLFLRFWFRFIYKNRSAVEMGSMKPAEPVKRVDPKYPSRALRKGGEGWVEISYVVGVNGNVQDPIVNDLADIKTLKMQREYKTN